MIVYQRLNSPQQKWYTMKVTVIVTAHIQRMGKVVFSQMCVCPWWGGRAPHGLWSQTQVLTLLSGRRSFQGLGVPSPVTGPVQGLGTPTPSQVRGIAWPRLWYPRPGQRSSLHRTRKVVWRGQCASCVYAGGLSCLVSVNECLSIWYEPQLWLSTSTP